MGGGISSKTKFCQIKHFPLKCKNISAIIYMIFKNLQLNYSFFLGTGSIINDFDAIQDKCHIFPLKVKVKVVDEILVFLEYAQSPTQKLHIYFYFFQFWVLNLNFLFKNGII